MNTILTDDEVRSALLALQHDPTMITESKYSPLASEYIDNQLPFVEIHLAYLRKNKFVDPSRYISNLRLMIKRR